jgi:hypothetical protein
MIIVKKFISGMLVGMLLMCGIAVAGQIIAEQVNYKILVNGKQVQLAKQPVSIDDSTYLPLRAVAELVGYDVGFNDTKGEISLTTKQIPQVIPQESKPVSVKMGLAVDGIEKTLTQDMLLKDGIYYYPASLLSLVMDFDTPERTNDGGIKFSYKGKMVMIMQNEWFIYNESSAIPINTLVDRFGWSLKIDQNTLNITR